MDGFPNRLYVYFKNTYLFTIHYKNFDFDLRKIVESHEGIIENFSFQFERQNDILIDVDIASKYPECNVHVQFEQPWLSNGLEFHNGQFFNHLSTLYFNIEIKCVGNETCNFVACKFNTVGDLKNWIKPNVPKNQILLFFNGIKMNNDEKEIGLYGINRPSKIIMAYRLGHETYFISQFVPNLGFAYQNDPSIKKDSSNEEDQNYKLICRVCMDKPARYTYTPCGHLCVCYACKEKIHSQTKKCPMCNNPYKNIIKTFF